MVITGNTAKIMGLVFKFDFISVTGLKALPPADTQTAPLIAYGWSMNDRQGPQPDEGSSHGW